MFFVPEGLSPDADPGVNATPGIPTLPPSFLMEMFSLGGREEARLPEEGGPTVPADVVVLWYQSHPGYDPPQRAQLW